MTPDDFRRLALSLPEATENAHMAHPDFRVRGKIFATLGYPKEGWGMVKLSPEQQELIIEEEPGIFVPAKGAWGRSGCTTVDLESVDERTLHDAIIKAWLNTAPKKLAKQFEEREQDR